MTTRDRAGPDCDQDGLRGAPSSYDAGRVNLHDWIDALMDALDIETEVDEGLILDLAREAAHRVQSPAAPISTYLLGYAAALAGGRPEKVEASRRPGRSTSPGRWEGEEDLEAAARGRRAPDRRGRPGRRRRDPRPRGRGSLACAHARRRRHRARRPRGPDRRGACPTPTPGRARSSSTSPRRRSTAPTCCSGRGFYPPPPGASDVIGLECSGTVAAVGAGRRALAGRRRGVRAARRRRVRREGARPRRAAAARARGRRPRRPPPRCPRWPAPSGPTSSWWPACGPARRCSSTAAQAASAPSPSSSPTRSAPGSRTTAGSAAKLEVCRALGADVTVELPRAGLRRGGARRPPTAAAPTSSSTTWAPVPGPQRRRPRPGGRLVVIGMQGGSQGRARPRALMRKRGAVFATTLRARPAEEKAAICAAVEEHVWPLVADGSVRPVVHARLPLDRGRRGPPCRRGEHPRRQDPAHHRAWPRPGPERR